MAEFDPPGTKASCHLLPAADVQVRGFNMFLVSRVVAWHWQWRVSYSWVKDFFPLVALATVCITLSLLPLFDQSVQNQMPAVRPGVFGIPAYLAIDIFQVTHNAAAAMLLVVLALGASAYWLRQKIRILYGVLELVLGVLVAEVAIAFITTDVAKGGLTPTTWNQDVFRMVTGVYFVIRGMTNTKDGIDVRQTADNQRPTPVRTPASPVVAGNDVFVGAAPEHEPS